MWLVDGDKPKRGTTHLGDRNEDRSARPIPPRNVGLTEPPVMAIAAALVAPKPAVVPRNEFDFEQRTPPAMDPSTYHALQTMRAEVLNIVTPILSMVEAREIREAKARDAKEKRDAEDRERRRKYIVPIITAIGIAITGIVAAVVHGCA